MKLKSIIALSLISTMIYTPVDTKAANAIATKEDKQISIHNNQSEYFSKMTNEELNSYINDIMLDFQEDRKPTTNLDDMDTIQYAWLAAAQIARNKGYDCAATLVEYSVRGWDFEESNLFFGEGIFCTKIKNSSAYKNFCEKLKKNKSLNTSIAFNRSDNSDLFFAIHLANISGRLEYGNLSSSYLVEVSDVFDFKYDNNYDSIFASSVNNWAWLCQQAYMLQPINVTIKMYQSK